MDPLIERELRDKIIKYCLGCQILIQKIDGCNYVKCSYCQCEMCWVCDKKKGAGDDLCPFGHPTHNSH